VKNKRSKQQLVDPWGMPTNEEPSPVNDTSLEETSYTIEQLRAAYKLASKVHGAYDDDEWEN
jgi:hypothetical protein